jgi:translation initiation factor IF-2
MELSMDSGETTVPGKVRVYEVAKEFGLPNKDALAKLRSFGIEVKNHMSSVDAEDVARLKRALDKERQANLVEQRLTSTVIRRRSKDGTQLRPSGVPAAATPARPTVEEQVEARKPEPVVEARKPEPEVEKPELEAQMPEPEPKKAEPVAEARKPEPVVEVRKAEPELKKPEPEPKKSEPEPKAHEAAAEARKPEAEVKKPEAEPKKEEPKFGPTGRVIELPLPRIEIRQADPRDRFAQQRQQPGGMPGQRRDTRGGGHDRFAQQKKKAQPGKKQKSTQITTPAAHKRIVRMEETIQVSELARQMSVKAPDVLKKLWGMGMTGIMLNNSIDLDTATILATDFGFEVESTAFKEEAVIQQAEDKAEDLAPRAPVVTIMGHVDHGKTSLLDAIRDANVAAGEAGGITQHIGAYKITTAEGNDVVFLDTPGHEAFTAMRARGAQATDIVVLVVAADDGVMQTTIEALNHAKDAEVPIIVAVNKIDKQNAQPERVRQQLADHGLIPEAWGGETIYVDLSARTKQGVDQLLQMLALQAEVLELKANPNKAAKGTVVEAKLDRNRGPMATVLVQDGTLKVGDTVVAGEHIGKVRAMLDEKGRNLTEAGPSTPVEVLGLGGVPEAGEALNSVEDEKQAKELVEHRRDSRRKKELGSQSKVSLENLLERIKEGAVKELKVVLKADVQGSSEALKGSLGGLSTEQVKVDVISSGVGGITESDVNLAKAGGAIIVGFHVRPAGKAQQLAEQEGVQIKLYDIIYEALDDVKKAMAGLLAPVRREKAMGKAEVRQVFTIPKVGAIAGSFVTEGTLRRNALARLVRDSVQIYQGRLASLRRFKDDVREVVQGYECGIGIENYNDIKVGDVIEAYEIEEIAATL